MAHTLRYLFSHAVITKQHGLEMSGAAESALLPAIMYVWESDCSATWHLWPAYLIGFLNLVKEYSKICPPSHLGARFGQTGQLL